MYFGSTLIASAVGVEAPGATETDRLERLYDPELKLAQSGEPTFLVRLLKGQTTVRIKSTSALRFKMGAMEPAEIIVPGETDWVIGIEDIVPGRKKHWVAAERFSGDDAYRASLARSRWVGRGYAARVVETGALINLKDHSFDSRQVTIAIAPEATHRAAKRRAARVRQSREVLGTIIEQVVKRSVGTFVARHPKTGEQLRAPRMLTVEPVDPDGTVEISGVSWPGRRRGDRRFRGQLIFLMGKDRKLLVVNRVSAETLVSGVVPSEIYPRAPLEVLKAQAVVARGFLVSKVRNRHRGEPYHLCAESHCQAYHGVTRTTPHTDAAVTATRGQVMLFSNVLIDTTYHSACGGHTEAYDKMWGGERSRAMPGVSDGIGQRLDISDASLKAFLKSPPAGAWCRKSATNSKVFRWTDSISGAAVTRAVNAREAIGPVHQIQVTERGVSGRVIRVTYHGASGSHSVRGATANRRILGGLNSGLWLASREGGEPGGEPQRWFFLGGGYGHGVGMCQHGAIGMAKAGRGYRKILAHYYRSGRLEALW